MKLNELILYLETHPIQAAMIDGHFVERVQPSDPRIVALTRWSLLRDGTKCSEGTDILTRRKTEYGNNILYVNFRKPGADSLDTNQTIYRIKL